MPSLSVRPAIQLIKQAHPEGYKPYLKADLQKCGFHAPLLSRTLSKLGCLNVEQYTAFKSLLTRLRGRIDQVYNFPGTIPLFLPSEGSLRALSRLDLFIQDEAAVTDIFKRGFMPERGKLDLSLLPWAYNQHIR